MGYLLDHCRFDRLSSEIISRCQPYSCSKDSDIDSFFHLGKADNFVDYQSEMMAFTHCFYTDEENPRMVCAFSLSNSALRIKNLPNEKRKSFNKKIPYSKRRSQYPAILIGQLCIFDGFGNKDFPNNVGNEMMNLIKTIAIDSDNNSAVRYLVVDAINEPNVIEFYKRNGFVFLFESEEDELKCLRGKSLNEESEIHCRTRLMLFDLITLKD